MSTIINTPGADDTSRGGWVIGLVIVVILGLLAVFFLPRILNGQGLWSTTPAPVSNTYNTTVTPTNAKPADATITSSTTSNGNSIISTTTVTH